MTIFSNYLVLLEEANTKYGKRSIPFLQVGVFFEVYGSQDSMSASYALIYEFSKICDLKVTPKTNGNCLMAGFRDYQLDRYIKKMMAEGYTIPVYEQDINTVGKITRNLVRVYSPGTYTDIDDDNRLNNYIMCIWIEINQRSNFIHQGMACIDVTTSRPQIIEFTRDYYHQPTTYDQLEQLINFYQPSEVIIVGNNDSDRLSDIVKFIGIRTNVIHLHSTLRSDHRYNSSVIQCEKQTIQYDILSSAYHENTNAIFQKFSEMPIAMQALCLMIRHIHQYVPTVLSTIMPPEYVVHQSSMWIGNNSLQQLNIFSNNKQLSLSKHLNRCFTTIGKRAFNNILRNPITDYEELLKSYQYTEIGITFDWQQIRNELRTITSLERVFYRHNTIKFKLSDIAILHRNLTSAANICASIMSVEKFIELMKADINIFDLYKRIQSIILYISERVNINVCNMYETLKEAIVGKARAIKENYSTEMDKHFETLIEDQNDVERIIDYFNTISGRKDDDGKPVKLHVTDHNTTILTTSRCASIIKQSLENHTPDDMKELLTNIHFEPQTSKKNSKVLISSSCIRDKLYRLACSNVTIYNVMQEAINELLSEVFENKKFKQTLIDTMQLIERSDILQCKVSLAMSLNLVKPNIENNVRGMVDIKGLRHVLIESMMYNELYVTNDVKLDDTSTGILLYGTNAVGKTCLMKALGICVIMAQCGLYVPCTSMTFTPYKRLYTRIDNNDDMYKGLSTFAVEMSELRTIMMSADTHTLVLGDELCSGTEHMSAVSICSAAIERLHEQRCSFLFATHLHELTKIKALEELSSLSVMHMSVIYNPSTKILVYDRKLCKGSGNMLYGLEVCKAMDLPHWFIDKSYFYRDAMMSIHGCTTYGINPRQSRYNSDKLLDMCEICNKKPATQTHHLQHQENADDNGFIHTDRHTFHKNHVANLMGVCEKCHKESHKMHTKGQYYVKKSKNHELKNIEVSI